MDMRPITPGERRMLMDVFGPTLPYDTQDVDFNDHEFGGVNNSVTPDGVPFMAPHLAAADYSDTALSDIHKWVFIHEMTHVWQYYHGHNHKILYAIGNWISHGFDYSAAYPYDLSDSTDFDDYNFEQQASIVGDFWYVSNSKEPRKNTGSDKSLRSYMNLVVQVQVSGMPRMPMEVSMRYRH
jgi:hypothetical protein